MSIITIEDLLKCASQTLAYSVDIPPTVPQTFISESEHIPPISPRPEPAIPTAMHVDTRILSFETKSTAPLCLKPPKTGYHNRYVDDEKTGGTTHAHACKGSNIPEPTVPKREEEWRSWIVWDHVV